MSSRSFAENPADCLTFCCVFCIICMREELSLHRMIRHAANLVLRDSGYRKSAKKGEDQMKMQKHKLCSSLTAAAVAVTSLSAAGCITASAAGGAGGYTWVKTSGYQEATVAVTDADGKTTVTFADADNKEYIAGFCAENGDGWDWSDYTKLSVTVKNTGDSAVTFGLAVGTGAKWNWYQSNSYATIDAGASENLTYYLTGEEWSFGDTVSAVADLFEVHRISMMVSAPTDQKVTGSIEISALELGGSAAATVEPKNGFYVDGAVLRDANQKPFVMRGTNYAYTWYSWDGKTEAALKEIAGYGANVVRIVLGDGDQYTKNTAGEIGNLIKLCEQNKLVAVFEVHDATGKDDKQPLLNAAKYFTEIGSALKGHEDTVIINIANEWQGSPNDSAWKSAYTEAVKIIRDAGLKHCIMCDAGGWGQTASTAINGGAAVLEADPEHNTMFSVHMYGYAGGSKQMIKNIMDSMITRQLCLVIGEFGYKHSDGDVDEAYIMEYAQQTNTGWMAWSWYGNGSPVEYLDMSNANAGGTLSKDWGEVIINGKNGWKETAKICSVFTDAPAETTASAAASTTTTTVTTSTTAVTTTTTAAATTTTTVITSAATTTAASTTAAVTTTTTTTVTSAAAATTTVTTTASATESTAKATETTVTSTVTTTTAKTVTVSLLGDVDNSSKVDVADAVLLARFNAEDTAATVSAQGIANADTNKNGKPDSDDVVLILKSVAKLVTLG